MPPAQVAFHMFERWRQENFFKYHREEYALTKYFSKTQLFKIFGADVYNYGVLYLDSTSTIGVRDGNPAVPPI